MTARLARSLVWIAWALPVGGAILHFLLGEVGHWFLRLVSGALFGLGLALMLWRGQSVPPYANWLGAFAAAAFGASLLLLAAFAWKSDLGTYLVILALAVLLGWALTR